MHLTPSDPDVATLYRKISTNRLDLQPNFQRGEVWGKIKKQRLIDSILRGWHIPPIHIIQSIENEKLEVLDGQQRLAAIRDFLENRFPIDGSQEPVEASIEKLDGLYWSELPEEVQSKIEDFTIRVLTISDYSPGEPGELFYRLNQPTNLTSAEQRNAYFGEARQQVKDLSDYMEEIGYNRDILGFSNSRMAYDDVIAKFLVTLECGTLKQKITANTVTSRYRDTKGFSKELLMQAKNVLTELYSCLSERKQKNKLNKATLYSWLLFIFKLTKLNSNELPLKDFFEIFESLREGTYSQYEMKGSNKITASFIENLLLIYQDRASSRVADISSVLLRDVVIWIVFYSISTGSDAPEDILYILQQVFSASDKETLENILTGVLKEVCWGEVYA